MTVDEVRDLILPVLEERDAMRAIVFGSVARGSHDERSDVDIIVIDEEDLPYLRRLDKYFDPLSRALGGPLDLFVYRPVEVGRMASLPFLRGALREGVVVYERGKARPGGEALAHPGSR